MEVAIVDYRAGNITSVIKALFAVGVTPRVVDRSIGLTGAQAIVIPGVGHFDATKTLDDDDRRTIGAYVAAGVPLLGICLGMQWLFEGSEEAPDLPGLGVFPGRCVRISESELARLKPRPTCGGAESTVIKIPHVGWNTLEVNGRPSRLLDGLPDGVAAYFTHSYAAPDGEATVARTTHGVAFTSVAERNRVFGTQFHPEKSGAVGVQMLARFVEIAREANTRC